MLVPLTVRDPTQNGSENSGHRNEPGRRPVSRSTASGPDGTSRSLVPTSSSRGTFESGGSGLPPRFYVPRESGKSSTISGFSARCSQASPDLPLA